MLDRAKVLHGPQTRRLGKTDTPTSLQMSNIALTHDGPLESPTLNPTFSDGRTFCDIKHMVMFLIIPT